MDTDKSATYHLGDTECCADNIPDNIVGTLLGDSSWSISDIRDIATSASEVR